jgi:hypothetical protein
MYDILSEKRMSHVFAKNIIIKAALLIVPR